MSKQQNNNDYLNLQPNESWEARNERLLDEPWTDSVYVAREADLWIGSTRVFLKPDGTYFLVDDSG